MEYRPDSLHPLQHDIVYPTVNITCSTPYLHFNYGLWTGRESDPEPAA